MKYTTLIIIHDLLKSEANRLEKEEEAAWEALQAATKATTCCDGDELPNEVHAARRAHIAARKAASAVADAYADFCDAEWGC